MVQDRKPSTTFAESWEAVRSLRLGFVVLAAVATAACNIRIDIERAAIARIAHSDRLEGAAETGGTEIYQARLYVSRDALERFLTYEMNAYIDVVDCETGQIEYAVFPYVDGASIESSEELRAVLERSDRPTFVVAGDFRPHPGFRRRMHCLTLTGGGYTLTRIDAPRVRADWE